MKYLFSLFLMVVLLPLSARECIIMDATSDPDQDGFWDGNNGTIQVINNIYYCPATNGGNRLIDKENKENYSCQFFDNGFLQGFKFDRVRSQFENNASPAWMKSSHPGQIESLNRYDDDCDGMVNEFTFVYFPYGSHGQSGQNEFEVTLKINEPNIIATNDYNIRFEVFEIEQLNLTQIKKPYQGNPPTSPIATISTPYYGYTSLVTTITVPENKDQVYAVRAKLMTREVFSRQIIGFDIFGNAILEGSTTPLLKDQLLSDYFVIYLSKYENGISTSQERSAIVNNGLYYTYLADTGYLSRQNNYDSLTGTGFDVILENGTFFLTDRDEPWCGGFIAATYYFIDEGIQVDKPSDYLSGNTQLAAITIADWFNQVRTSKNNGTDNNFERANLMQQTFVKPVSTTKYYVPTAYYNNSASFFTLEKLRAGDYIAINDTSTNYFFADHATMFLGFPNDGKILTIEGNQGGNSVLIKDRYKGEIFTFGTLPY